MVIDYFVLTLDAAVLQEDRLLDSHEKTIGEDIFKTSIRNYTSGDVDLHPGRRDTDCRCVVIAYRHSAKAEQSALANFACFALNTSSRTPGLLSRPLALHMLLRRCGNPLLCKSCAALVSSKFRLNNPSRFSNGKTKSTSRQGSCEGQLEMY